MGANNLVRQEGTMVSDHKMMRKPGELHPTG
jgi:hypothetical protein